MKRKKGILPLKYLVTIVMAIIILVPTIAIASMLLGKISSEARDSFFDFVDKLEEMEKSPDENIDTTSVFLDDKSAIVYFEPNENEIEIDVHVTPGLSYSVFVIHIKRPITKECSDEDACICLVKDPNVIFDDRGLGDFKITPKKSPCSKTVPNVKFSNCGLGEPHEVDSYNCKQGFFIEKNFVKEIISSPKNAYFEFKMRKISLIMEKQGENVVLEG